MRIANVSVTGLHGFIDADLNFENDLVIIVGANGAGKTSILNLTSYALKLDIVKISLIRFSSLRIMGRVEKKPFELTCARSGSRFNISLKVGSKIIDSLVVHVPAWEEFGGQASRFAFDRTVRRIYDAISDSALANYLKANAKITLVTLDRTLLAEESNGLTALDAPGPAKSGGHVSILDPVSRVAEVTSTRYNKYRIESRKHQEELTRQVILQLFKSPKALWARSNSQSKLNISQVDDIRRKVAKMPSFAEAESVTSQIHEYFELAIQSLQDIGPRDIGNEQHIKQLLFRDFEFPKIVALVKAFEAFEKADNNSRSELDRFERLVNSFLVESGKEVFFSEKEASLRFRLKGSIDATGRSISELSSGERQIITMLTYLAFMVGEGSIFLVDEPELSLHLSWQMKLVDALMELKPAEVQLVLATHSPEIVGKHRQSVVKLVPQYKELANNVRG